MKRRVYVLGISFVIVLAVVAVFVFIIQPPGSLTHPLFIKKADKSDVGKVVELSLSELAGSNGIDYVYVYNSTDKTGKLGIFTKVVGSSDFGCLTVYEPAWSGVECLACVLEEPFSAKIVDRVYITWIESNIYLHNAVIGSCEESIDELSDISTPNAGIVYCLGSLTSKANETYPIELSNGYRSILKIGSVEGSVNFQNDLAVFLQIVRRFNLAKSFNIQ